jgi:hypothetical protein
MTSYTTAIARIHDAVNGFCDTIKADGLPAQLPEKVYCPADVYDVAVEQAKQFYPTVQFIREPDFEAFLTVARDPAEVC